MKERLPVVALVGRPNVGKSRLFNRFVRSRMAIVENTPGVTRDRNYGMAHWEGCRFTVIDTGGFEPESSDVLLEQMRVQAQLAVEEADVILFLVDARAGLLPADRQIADILRRSDKRLILVVNKVDQPRLVELSYEFYELALDEMVCVSAEHGVNFGELTEPMFRTLPATLLVTLGGFITNAVYCFYQNSKNHTWSDYGKSGVIVNNLLFCALAGLLWYSQFFGLSLGKGFLTSSPVLTTLAFCILMALNVVFSNVWGIILKEWKGCSRSTIMVLVLGLAILIISSFLPQLL